MRELALEDREGITQPRNSLFEVQYMIKRLFLPPLQDTGLCGIMAGVNTLLTIANSSFNFLIYLRDARLTHSCLISLLASFWTRFRLFDYSQEGRYLHDVRKMFGFLDPSPPFSRTGCTKRRNLSYLVCFVEDGPHFLPTQCGRHISMPPPL